MRLARQDRESTRAISTIRRVLGRPGRSSRSGRATWLKVLRVLAAVPFMLFISVIALWWFGAMRSALTGPGATFQLEELSFTLQRGQGLTLGRAHLMQWPGYDSAEADH